MEVVLGSEGGKLIFSPCMRDEGATYVDVTYVNGAVRGTTRMEDELCCIPGGGRPQAFFRHLADDWRGWEGERVWGDASGQCLLRATNDGLSRVTMAVELLSSQMPFDVRISGGLYIELGQLPGIANQMEELFGRPDWADHGPNASRAGVASR